MAEVSYPFDAGAGSIVTEQQWSNLATPWQDNGVMADGPWQNFLKVTTLAEPGIVYLEVGEAHILGFHYENTTQKALAVPANNNGANSRIDLVALQLDKNTNAVKVVYKTGTAASSPVAPALVTTGGLYEIALAQIQMGPNATSVPNTQPQLVDKRSYVGRRMRVTDDVVTLGPIGGVNYSPTAGTLRLNSAGVSKTLATVDQIPSSPGAQPKTKLIRTTTMTLGSIGGSNVIPWQSILTNVGGMGVTTSSSPADQRIVVPTTGLYIVMGYIEFSGNNTGSYRTGLIRHSTDGVVLEDNKLPMAEPVRCNPVSLHLATAGTYFQLEAWYNASAVLNLQAAWFGAALLL